MMYHRIIALNSPRPAGARARAVRMPVAALRPMISSFAPADCTNALAVETCLDPRFCILSVCPQKKRFMVTQKARRVWTRLGYRLERVNKQAEIRRLHVVLQPGNPVMGHQNQIPWL